METKSGSDFMTSCFGHMTGAFCNISLNGHMTLKWILGYVARVDMLAYAFCNKAISDTSSKKFKHLDLFCRIKVVNGFQKARQNCTVLHREKQCCQNNPCLDSLK